MFHSLTVAAPRVNIQNIGGLTLCLKSIQTVWIRRYQIFKNEPARPGFEPWTLAPSPELNHWSIGALVTYSLHQRIEDIHVHVQCMIVMPSI